MDTCSPMLPDATLALQAIQLLYENDQETRRLLNLALSQNQVLSLLTQQQQDLVSQQQQTIHRLETELRACRSAQQATFGLVHTN